MIMAVLGGDAGGGVVWAPQVIEEAQAHGLVLAENGRLYDSQKVSSANRYRSDANFERRRTGTVSGQQPKFVLVCNYWD